MKTFLKKSIVALFVAVAALFPSLALTSTSASAITLFDTSECPSGSFLGLVSWCSGVPSISTDEDLKSGIWQIAANVATDITVAAAYLVLGFVIYGGYLYIFAAGDAGKVAAGKKTLSQAFIGLAIVMLANVIMSSIRIALVGAGGNIGACDITSGAGCTDVNTMVANAIQWVIGMAGVVAAIFVVYGGISYMTSRGDPGKLQVAKNMIIYALIGLVIVALAEVITAFISNMIRNAETAAFTQNPSTALILESESIENHLVNFNNNLNIKEFYETKIN